MRSRCHCQGHRFEKDCFHCLRYHCRCWESRLVMKHCRYLEHYLAIVHCRCQGRCYQVHHFEKNRCRRNRCHYPVYHSAMDCCHCLENRCRCCPVYRFEKDRYRCPAYRYQGSRSVMGCYHRPMSCCRKSHYLERRFVTAHYQIQKHHLEMIRFLGTHSARVQYCLSPGCHSEIR